MGAAISSNTASAISNVTNQIQDSTTVDSEQSHYISTTSSFKNCDIQGNLDVENVSQSIQKNRQITTALQNTAVKNKISQDLMQQAQSTMGSLGIGVADASNAASVVANASTAVSDAVSSASGEHSWTNNNFGCDGSYIGGNVNLSNKTIDNSVNDQVTSSNQATKISNTVSQTVSQKASATVQGALAGLIGIALIIVAIGYVFAKGINSTPVKIIVIVVIVIILAALIIWMYIASAPPFFNPPNKCVPGINTGCQANSTNPGENSCVNVSQNTINLLFPPLKYLNPIFPTESTSAGINLVDILITNQVQPGGDTSGIKNQGYNGESYINLGDISSNYRTLKMDSTYNQPYWKDYLDYSNNDSNGFQLFTGTSPSIAQLPNLLTITIGGKSYLIPENQSDCSPSYINTVNNISSTGIPMYCNCGSSGGQPEQCCTGKEKCDGSGVGQWVSLDTDDWESVDKKDPSKGSPFLALRNNSDWSKYLAGEKMPDIGNQSWPGQEGENWSSSKQDAIALARCKHARFILIWMFHVNSGGKIDNYYYMDSNGMEEFAYIASDNSPKTANCLAAHANDIDPSTGEKLNSDAYGKAYKYSTEHTITPVSQNAWLTGLSSLNDPLAQHPGTVSGLYGDCNSNLYKFETNFRIYGTIGIVIIVILLIVLIIVHKKHGVRKLLTGKDVKGGNGTPKKKSWIGGLFKGKKVKGQVHSESTYLNTS